MSSNAHNYYIYAFVGIQMTGPFVAVLIAISDFKFSIETR